MRTHKRFLLTSFLALGFAYPAMAVSEYQVSAGEYLPAGATAVADCIPGYYCPGLDSPVGYDAGQAQGLTQCPSGYSSSDSGASSQAQCYKACNVADFPHAQSVSGNDYFAFGADTCTVDSCVAGWHVVAASTNTTDFQQYIGGVTGHAVNSAYIDAANGQYYHNYNSEYDPLLANCEDSGTCNSAISAQEAPFYGMASNGADAGLGLWAVGYGAGNGFVRGIARLSETSGSEATASTAPSLKTTAQLGDEGGTNCYCNITGYRLWIDSSVAADANPWGPATSSWAYAGTANSLGSCASMCASKMSSTDTADLSFRSALMGSVQSTSVASCVANTITINWNGVGGNQKADGTTMSNYNGTTHTGSSSVNYGKNVVTPTTPWAPIGKRFKGWRFSTSAPTE